MSPGIMLVAVMLLLYFSCQQSQAACNSGWFGSKCQYLCHCDASGQCDVNGQCSTKCAAGWFGLKCQYQDLTTIPGVTVSTTPAQTSPTWLTDGNDVTCNADQSLQSVKISWNTTYPFTWLRFKVKDPSAKMELSLKYITAINQTFSCYPMITILDDTSVDYICDVNDTVQQLSITGSGMPFLCSIYVSGGRNMALKQTATQTSIYLTYDGSLAVDGNNNSSFSGGSCTHTSEQDTNPSLTVTFDSAKSLQRFVLYNRGDCCLNRLQYFKLETIDSGNNTLWTYQETRDALLSYQVSTIRKNNVSKVRISTKFKPPGDNLILLTLCEVEIFGECVPGKWGLECNKTCPNVCSTWCHQDTGQCPSCLGFSDPPHCKTECLKGCYGSNCQSKCSSHCYNDSCDRFTGICNNGCLGYNNPPVCTIACGDGLYGPNCLNHCPSSCYQGSCDKLTGLCDKACFGYSDFPTCTTKCLSGSWGYNCESTCGDKCYNKSCNGVTGLCDKGCNGYSNQPDCDAECQGTWGPNCQFNCRTNCYNNTCDKITGVCDQGCNGYMDPPDCIVECKVSKWGHNCVNTCSSKCIEQTCNRVSGICDATCESLHSLTCPSDCHSGYYGQNCTFECPPNCKDSTCSNHGYCVSCQSEYTGHFCEEMPKESKELTFEAGIGIGIAVGAFAVAVIAVVVIIVCNARRNKARTRSKQNNETNRETKFQSYEGFTQKNEYQHSYETTRGNSVFNTANSRNSDHNSRTAQYENSVSTEYETIGGL